MAAQYTYEDLLKIIERLRGKEGCPWDREQTHESLKTHLLEESYELVDAIDNQDVANTREELGDVLLQVLLHAEIGKEEGEYSMEEIINELATKLVYRHPHVFGSEEGIETASDVSKIWEELKKKEKKEKTVVESMDRVAKALPALIRAQKIQKKASKISKEEFDSNESLEQIISRCKGLSNEVNSGENLQIEEEIGEMLFEIVKLSTFFDINAEFALTKSVEKFINRFRYIEN